MIGAGSGPDSGGWSRYVAIYTPNSSNLTQIRRWSTKQPLHLSSEYPVLATSSPIPANAGKNEQDLRSSVSVSPESPIDSSILHSTMMTASTMPVIVDHPTPMEPNSSGDSSNESFTTAFAMLLYNVCYLAYTQSVDIPLSQAGDALSNLWAVCCSNDLGRSFWFVSLLVNHIHMLLFHNRRSHATTPTLPPPTPPTFPLDFPQLLQATTASPARLRPSRRHGKRRESTIVEEEEGWDLMNDVAS